MKADPERVQAIVQRLGMSGDTLLQRLQAVKEQAFDDKQQLTRTHPGWDPHKDARLLCLAKFIGLMDRAQFGLNILGKTLDDDWLDSNIGMECETQRESDYKLNLIVDFEKSLKYGFGMSVFTLMESCLRTCLRALDPAACKGATTAFESVYKSLLGSKQLGLLATDRQSADQLLDLVRPLRSLIHNEGVYFNEDGNDKTVTYRGVKYWFHHGQPVAFVYWCLLLRLADDARQLLTQVASHPRIAGLSQVTDPFMAVHP